MTQLSHTLWLGAVSLCLAATALGDDYYEGKQRFTRIATLANYQNNENLSDETVSEIVAATRNGRTLVYTDGELDAIGLVDISNPHDPKPAGKVDVGGEPTSVDVLGNQLALVAVNTSESLTNTSGELVVVDIRTRRLIGSVALSGQPDSIKISKNGNYVAIAIENERDEELCVGGTQSGAPVPEDGPEAPGDITEGACEMAGGFVGVLPQTAGSDVDTNGNLNNPPGALDIVDIRTRNPARWSLRTVDLTGLSAYAPEDPEPEFVDINGKDQAVVTLQENNHIAIVDLKSGKVVGGFELGTVDLEDIDATEDGRISLTENLHNVPREPDAVAWVKLGWKGEGIATANEGDLFGGSRGWSIFSPEGDLLFDTGNRFEKLAVQHGHYPEERSENKGSEPEAIEYARIRGHDYVFVGSERGSFIAVYRLEYGRPVFQQVLAGPLGPEGLLAIENRGLLVVSGEEDDPDFGVRSSIMIYALTDRRPNYPQIVSRRVDGQPIPFSALSGMDTLPGGNLLAVWDSFYSESKIFTINPRRKPARVVAEHTISGGSGNFDPEGIAIAPDDTLWIASEGNRSGSRLNRILQLDRAGNVIEEIFLPAEIEACRATERAIDGNIGSHSAGFEGIAILETKNGYKLLVPQQRGWDYTTDDCEALDDDPDGSNPEEPAFTRIWIYDPATGNWDFVPWELAPVPANAAWAGLSEITAADRSYIVIERDNRTGDFAELKTLVRVSVNDGKDGVSAHEKQVYDLLPALRASNGWVSDKPEGTAIGRRGRVYLVTDNDGVDDWSGETSFLRLGTIDDLFEDDDDDDD